MLNTIAGGGTFLTFPALVNSGVPVGAANAMSAVAVFPGYLGGALGFGPKIPAFDRKRGRLREGAKSYAKPSTRFP